ncbi:hypothetical protein ACIQ4I_05650 [Rummeliibacillus sp. NPDC094406]|uniref:hypothetical protein n=1 Tax=Rummeliibacillus sp. NPDC094406 TaxID=3364511 RepID=UPI0037F8DE0D
MSETKNLKYVLDQLVIVVGQCNSLGITKEREERFEMYLGHLMQITGLSRSDVVDYAIKAVDEMNDNRNKSIKGEIAC